MNKCPLCRYEPRPNQTSYERYLGVHSIQVEVEYLIHALRGSTEMTDLAPTAEARLTIRVLERIRTDLLQLGEDLRNEQEPSTDARPT